MFGVLCGLVESLIHISCKNDASQNVTVNGESYRSMIADFLEYGRALVSTSWRNMPHSMRDFVILNTIFNRKNGTEWNTIW